MAAALVGRFGVCDFWAVCRLALQLAARAAAVVLVAVLALLSPCFRQSLRSVSAAIRL